MAVVFVTVSTIGTGASVFDDGSRTLRSRTDAVLDNTYHNLTPVLPFSQNWTDAALITADDNWLTAPSIIGYRGDNLTATTGTDPQTILVDDVAVVDVNANRSDPGVFNTGGVSEFDGITNPVVAFQGSGTADAPHLDLHFNTAGCASPANTGNISYNLRDLDPSADDAIQRVALQYRVGTTGDFTNIAAGFVADATTANTDTQVTAVSVPIPTAALGQSQVHFRIMTTNAIGNDEMVGIDDINVTCTATTAAGVFISGRVITADGRGITNAAVTITGNALAEPRTVITGRRGAYIFDDLEPGETYIVTVRSRRFMFSNPSQVISIVDNVADADFIADGGTSRGR